MPEFACFLAGEIDLKRERFMGPSLNGEMSLGLVTQYDNRVWRMSPAQYTLHTCVGGLFLVRRGVFTHQRALLLGALGKAAILPRTAGRGQCECPLSAFLPPTLIKKAGVHKSELQLVANNSDVKVSLEIWVWFFCRHSTELFLSFMDAHQFCIGRKGSESLCFSSGIKTTSSLNRWALGLRNS